MTSNTDIAIKKCDIENKSESLLCHSALEKEKKLVVISQLSKEFIENSGEIIDYQKITDDARLLSEAKYIGLICLKRMVKILPRLPCQDCQNILK